MVYNDNSYQGIVDDLAGVYGLRALSVERTAKGRNSQVYRVLCDDKRHLAVKYYFRNSLDTRDRLKVEFSSLKFLWKNGVRCIPEPIMADDASGTAVYTYVQGSRPSPDSISNEDIIYAADFLSALKELRSAEGSEALPAASEACFSFQELLDNIDHRHNRLLSGTGDVSNDLFHEFIQKDLVDAVAEISKWCRAKLVERSISTERLPVEERTLSPSDFGFHNSLRTDSGQVFFLDFEYFGWDDPVKAICDFILHPAMGLSEEHRKTFYRKMLAHFADQKGFAQRVEFYYPLYGLKWCLIFLNEFLPDQMMRRRFAGCVEDEESRVLNDQLLKSRTMLDRIMGEYDKFPYNRSR